MSSLTVHNASGKAVGQVEFADALLTTRRGGQALQQAVVTIRANQRAGTASTKTKGEVAGHGQKPWRERVLALQRPAWVKVLRVLHEAVASLVKRALHRVERVAPARQNCVFQ